MGTVSGFERSRLRSTTLFGAPLHELLPTHAVPCLQLVISGSVTQNSGMRQPLRPIYVPASVDHSIIRQVAEAKAQINSQIRIEDRFSHWV